MNLILALIFALIFLGYGMLIHWAIMTYKGDKRVEKFILKNLSKKDKETYKENFERYDVTQVPQLQIFLLEKLGEEKFNILKAMLNMNLDTKIEIIKKTKQSTIYRINNELIEIWDGVDFYVE